MNRTKAMIHDVCPEHENAIWEYVEQLGDQRIKNYKTGRIEDIDLIIPILNGISDEVERYREYIREIKMSKLKIGARYKRWRRIGAHRAYRMCHVLAKTERGWLIDCGDGTRREISEEEAEELEEVK